MWEDQTFQEICPKTKLKKKLQEYKNIQYSTSEMQKDWSNKILSACKET